MRTTLLFASRFDSISAFPLTSIVVLTWACLISFCCTLWERRKHRERNDTYGGKRVTPGKSAVHLSATPLFGPRV
jgi:hypothetical protein